MNYPKIEFKYDWRSRFMDMVGSFIFNDVNSDLRDRLSQQLPIFIDAWEKNAPTLFDEVFSFFKRGFKDSKRTAIVYLSHNSSYGSARFLVLGLRYHLEPEPWLCPANRYDGFVNSVFHELLHIWVDENITRKTPLLQKYNAEGIHVKEHMHLMAIQKMVYLKLNRLDMLSMIDEQYRKLAHPQYTRAWEIVNDIEGHESVLNDIFDGFN